MPWRSFAHLVACSSKALSLRHNLTVPLRLQLWQFDAEGGVTPDVGATVDPGDGTFDIDPLEGWPSQTFCLTSGTACWPESDILVDERPEILVITWSTRQTRHDVEVVYMARARSEVDPDTAVFVISIAAELAGMHAQTLRQYDRLGLVTPQRTRGGGRRYSSRDVYRLREVQRLSQEGVSLEGIQRILELEKQVERLQADVADLSKRNDVLLHAIGSGNRIFAAGTSGEVVAMRAGARPQRGRTATALALWRPPTP